MNDKPDKTVLLTGFEPFGSFTENPTELVVNSLDGEIIAGHKVKGIVLPVVFGRAGDLLIKAVRENNPSVVVCLGLAGNRKAITPERIAVNLDDADIPDNAGNQPIDKTIVPDGASAYWSTLPVKAMVAALQEQQLSASLSMSAGTFVCNHAFYRLMHYLRDHPGTPGGFIHVPPLPAGNAGAPAQLRLGIETIISISINTRVTSA